MYILEKDILEAGYFSRLSSRFKKRSVKHKQTYPIMQKMFLETARKRYRFLLKMKPQCAWKRNEKGVEFHPK